jgi:hypothetical protein
MGTICGGPKEVSSIKEHSGSKYLKQIRSAVTQRVIGEVDIYAVCDAFGVTDMPIAHAIKKLLMPGIRGKGDKLKDLKEARDALSRAIETEEEKLHSAVQDKPAGCKHVFDHRQEGMKDYLICVHCGFIKD